MEKGIDIIRKAIEAVKEAEKRKEMEEKKREEKEKRKMKEYQKYKESMFKESLNLAEQIFNWAKNLLANKEMEQIFSFINERGFIDSGLVLKDMIPIFYGSGYLDMKPVEDKYAYTYLYLRKDGTFLYRERWKWAEANKIRIKTPEEMAKKLDPKFIKEVLNTIKSEKVWTTIANRILQERQK